MTQYSYQDPDNPNVTHYTKNGIGVTVIIVPDYVPPVKKVDNAN